MKIRCVRAHLSDDDMAALGPRFKKNQTFELSVGREYEVLGLICTFNAPARGTGAYAVVAVAVDRVTTAPLQLFEVINARVPDNWDLRLSPDEVELLPAELSASHFFEDLAEREPAALGALRRVLRPDRPTPS